MASGTTSLRSGQRLRPVFVAFATAAIILGSSALGTAARADDLVPLVADATVTLLPFESTSPPTVSGDAVVGQTLTATPGEYDSAPDDVSYQWVYVQAAGADSDYIDGATGDTLEVTDQFVGSLIGVEVTAVLGDESVWSTSDFTAAVTSGATITNVAMPTISGTLQAGSVLTIDPGTWSSPGATFTYEWFFASDNFGGPRDVTTVSYTILAEDVGLYVGVLVTAHDGDEFSDAARVLTTAIPLVTPAAPFATDAGIDPANQGSVTGSTSGDLATVTVPNGVAGENVFVYGYSTPVYLGAFVLDANKQIVVDYSVLPAGAHHLVVLDAAGDVLGWYAVTAAVPGTLAATGVEYDSASWAGVAGGMVLLGLLLAFSGRVTRRRSAVLRA